MSHSLAAKASQLYHPWSSMYRSKVYLQPSFCTFHTIHKLMKCQISSLDLTLAWPLSFISTLGYTCQLLVETVPWWFFRTSHIVKDSLCHPVWKDFSACRSHMQCNPNSIHHSSNHILYLVVLLDSYKEGFLLWRMLQMFENSVI